jgi:hypothetical protein
MTLYYPECHVVLKPVFEYITGQSEQLVIYARPLDVSIERNSYNKADSFSMTFDTRFLPISPAMIRSMGVEVYLYDRGRMQSPEQVTFADTKLGVVDPSGALATRPCIVGLIDDVSATFSNEGCQVTITGQDYTALFIEQKIPTHSGGKKIERKNFFGQRIDHALEALLKEADHGGAMSLKCDICGVQSGPGVYVVSVKAEGHPEYNLCQRHWTAAAEGTLSAWDLRRLQAALAERRGAEEQKGGAR